MKIALIQLSAGADKEKNIKKALTYAQEAISKKASWVLFPEVFSFRGNLRSPKVLQNVSEAIPGPTTKLFLDLVKKYNVDILLGSILEKTNSKKVYNTSVLISGRTGAIKKYRKIHLFDANVSGKIIRESEIFDKGSALVRTNVAEFKVGLSVCYDLRFADQFLNYRKKGITAFTVPSCFTKETGEAHWESLLRARAIENLSYVLAPNQVGKDFNGVASYGNSMVVGPWGEIVARASQDKEEIVYADISIDNINQARRKLPGIIKG